MPTKWTRLTLCFIAPIPQATQASADAIGGIGARELAPGHRHREQRFARERREACGKPFRRQVRLRNLQRRTRIDQKLRVRALLVGDRARQRHDDRGHADGRELGHGDRAAAAENDVGVGVVRRHVVDERHALRRRRRLARTRRATRRRAARRTDARRAGASAAGISASACGTQRLIAAAPRLPPTTSSRQRSRRVPRTGLPEAARG